MALTDWLKDTSNQNLLKFLGGTTVAVIGAGWAGYQALNPAKPVVETPKLPVVQASVPAPPAVTTPASAPVVGDTVIANSGVAVKVNGDGNQISIGK